MTTTDRYLVVSIDSHCGPFPAQLRDYCERKDLEAFDEWAASLSSEHDQLKDLLGIPDDVAEAAERPVAEIASRYTDGNTDIHERLRHMDEDGVAAEVIFHGGQNGQLIPFNDFTLLTAPGAYHLDQRQRTIGYHIYNRWLADWISVEPERHVGVAHVPFWDVEAAVAEIEWARSVGLTSVNFPSIRDDLTPYNDPCWEPVWAACAANEMPLSSHGGRTASGYHGIEAIALGLMEMSFFGRRAVWFMILGRVFENHPGLKLIITEQRWDDNVVPDMDSVYLSDPCDPDFPAARAWSGLRKALPRRPSEYFRESCFVGASMLSNPEVHAAIRNDLVGNVLWGSDYPHMEGCWPNTRLSLQKTFAGVPHDVTRQMIGANAAAVYGLDVERLQAVAARIGPTRDELDRPPDAKPQGNPGWAFREVGKWT
jgi:predicted TIM-barrel fold metal-dependent hydrolase